MSKKCLFSLKERKIAHESQKMPFGGVKITKSPIILQICQFEVKNWSNLKTNLYKHFIIHLKHSIVSKNKLFSPKEIKITHKSQKNALWRGQNHKMDNNSANKYVNLKSKNWANLETNWYKYFIIHFKHYIVSKNLLFRLK